MKSTEINEFVKALLVLRHSNDNGVRAAMMRGLSTTTESYAYPYVLPLLPPTASAHDQNVALIVAALIAHYDTIPAYSEEIPNGVRFGKWVAQTGRDIGSAETRIRFLHTQDLSEAGHSINRLLAMCPHTLPLDWKNLARTLFFWGTGADERSQRTRLSIARDYYTN